MLARIDVRHEPAFDAGGQKGRGRTRLVIDFKDGQRIEVNRQASRSIESPGSNDWVASKYRDLTAGLLDADRQARIEQVVRKLEEQEDVGELFRLLASPVPPAFD
jgi:hypothetical protein